MFKSNNGKSIKKKEAIIEFPMEKFIIIYIFSLKE